MHRKHRGHVHIRPNTGTVFNRWSYKKAILFTDYLCVIRKQFINSGYFHALQILWWCQIMVSACSSWHEPINLITKGLSRECKTLASSVNSSSFFPRCIIAFNKCTGTINPPVFPVPLPDPNAPKPEGSTITPTVGEQLIVSQITSTQPLSLLNYNSKLRHTLSKFNIYLHH